MEIGLLDDVESSNPNPWGIKRVNPEVTHFTGGDRYQISPLKSLCGEVYRESFYGF